MSHRLPFHRYVILLCVTLGAPIGDALLKRGMSDIGPVTLNHLSVLFVALGNVWVICGIAVLLGFMASFMTALTWADITFVLPATALGYVLTALFGRFWLNEQVSVQRWIGIALIVAGVGFVTRGPALTEENLAKNRSQNDDTHLEGGPVESGNRNSL